MDSLADVRNLRLEIVLVASLGIGTVGLFCSSTPDRQQFGDGLTTSTKLDVNDCLGERFDTGLIDATQLSSGVRGLSVETGPHDPNLMRVRRFLNRLRYLVTVPASQNEECHPKVIVFDGGPLDGKSWAELDGDEANVLMSDGQKHRYVRATEIREMADGSIARVFKWAGRYFGAE